MLQAVAVLIFVDQDAVVGSRDDFADGVDPEGARRATVELIPLLPGLRHAIRRLSHAGESMGVAHAPSSDGIDGDTHVRDAQALDARSNAMLGGASVSESLGQYGEVTVVDSTFKKNKR